MIRGGVDISILGYGECRQKECFHKDDGHDKTGERTLQQNKGWKASV